MVSRCFIPEDPGQSSLLIPPRLISPDLPSGNNIRTVVDHYFANIHPLRCFAFVHRPSFARLLDKGFESDDEKALLHIICAQGAKYVPQSELCEHGTNYPDSMLYPSIWRTKMRKRA